jgi:amidase
MRQDELCLLPATRLAALVQARELSARELLAAHLAQVERVNPRVNAIVTLTAERAAAEALACDEAQARGAPLGPLHGLPMAHKDLLPTRGIRSTRGSPIFANEIPQVDALVVERMRAAGGVTMGKTNTPEFGAGSHTFNTVFGTTLNPWDTRKTCGGSSGGAAVALATGMVAIADGSDLGGSLRNPGNFNSIVGFRPTLGRVPNWPEVRGWSGLSTNGPMARNVDDVALLLSVLAGPDPRAPSARNEPGSLFHPLPERDFAGTRVAWSPDLGGLPVDPAVRKVLARALPFVAQLGARVDDATPDFEGADEAFKALRAYAMTDLAPLLRTQRDRIKQTVTWNVEQGLALTAEDIGRAEAKRTELYHRMRVFLQEHDFLLCPVNQVPPFDIDTEYPTEIDGTPMATYIDWMKSCWYITITGHPAISLPAGFTDDGLPVGLQIVGRYGDDLGVLQFARALERLLGVEGRAPPIARAG